MSARPTPRPTLLLLGWNPPPRSPTVSTHPLPLRANSTSIWAASSPPPCPCTIAFAAASLAAWAIVAERSPRPRPSASAVTSRRSRLRDAPTAGYVSTSAPVPIRGGGQAATGVVGDDGPRRADPDRARRLRRDQRHLRRAARHARARRARPRRGRDPLLRA